MAEKLMTVKDLTIRFGGLTAVDGMSFDLSRNEILGVIGPNGAGKTTAFNMITGIYTPTSGEILYKDKLINGLAPHEVARLGIKRTFQQSRLFDTLSVLDNVLLGMAAVKKNDLVKSILRRDLLRKENDADIEKALDLLGRFSEDMRNDCYKPAGDLTPGDRRKLEICRALASDPEILLLDEPAAGMDPQETVVLMDDILKIRTLKDGIGIILIEHDMAVVQKTSDYNIVLSYGKVIAKGTFEEVSSDKDVQEAYLGSEE